MASTSKGLSAAPPAGGKQEDVQTTALKDEIYNASVPVANDNPDFVFHQDDFFGFDIIPNDDVEQLMKVLQALVNEKLFKLVSDGTLGWKVRSEEDAKKYRSLTYEQELVYALIDEAGADGIWNKTLKTKTGLHDANMRQAIKHLETKRMIADMKTVEHPTRKMYIKASIRPSDRATGGPWYTDNELDTEFISQVMSVLMEHVQRRTFYHSSSGSLRKPRKTKGKMSVEEAKEAKSLRDKTLGTPKVKSEIKLEDLTAEDEMAARKRRYDSLLPMPPGYQGYPTVTELTQIIDSGGFASVTLGNSDIQQLLDLMCFDDKIEKVQIAAGVGYKAIKKSFREEMHGGPVSWLMEAPCGRCPVFDLCEEGGPVGPSNCEYYKKWLDL